MLEQLGFTIFIAGMFNLYILTQQQQQQQHRDVDSNNWVAKSPIMELTFILTYGIYSYKIIICIYCYYLIYKLLSLH